MGIRLLGKDSIFTSDAPYFVQDVDSDLSVADYCAELELATPLTGRVTNEGGTPAVRDTGAWYARCQDSDEVNAWVRVDNTTLTFADIYLSSESPTEIIQVVPGFSYSLEVWALDKTNTVTYGEESSTDGSLVITLNLPNHITSKDLKKVYDDLEFTLGGGLVASEIWGKLDSSDTDALVSSIYCDPLSIIQDVFSTTPARLVPHAYDQTSFVTLTVVAGEGVFLSPEYAFATTTIPVTIPATVADVRSLRLDMLYQVNPEYVYSISICIGEISIYEVDADTTQLTEDAQVDIVGLRPINVTLNVGDVTSVDRLGSNITDQLPKSLVTAEGTQLYYFLAMDGISTTPTATGWKDMSDDTVILGTDVLVDGQSIYPYI